MCALRIFFTLFVSLTWMVGQAQNGQRQAEQLVNSGSGEHRCVTDSYFDQLKGLDATLGQRQADLDRQVFQWITNGGPNSNPANPNFNPTNSNPSNPNSPPNPNSSPSPNSPSGPRTGTILTIPTVVHIIHNNGPENITNSQVLTAIDDLNQALRNQGYYNPNTGVDLEIELCLVQQDPNGNATNGINRVVNPLTEFILETQDLDLKNLSRWNPDFFLNIWVVKEISSQFSGPSVAGYATFPSAHGCPADGIVIEHPYFGGSQDGTKLSAHELGHYLGLYHTFQDGCMNNDCYQDGDRVCDTPPDASTGSVPLFRQPQYLYHRRRRYFHQQSIPPNFDGGIGGSAGSLPGLYGLW